MEFYETQEMTAGQIRKFSDEIDRLIGTECEVNQSGSTRYYAVCGDLLPSEVRQCREIENLVTMTPSQKKAADIYGLCSVCWEQTYCPHKGAGTQRCKDFHPSNIHHR